LSAIQLDQVCIGSRAEILTPMEREAKPARIDARRFTNMLPIIDCNITAIKSWWIDKSDLKEGTYLLPVEKSLT
jgi:hypothetical protein